MDRLTVSADGFRLMDGTQPFVWRGTLTWPLFGLWMHDPAAARDVVQDRRSVGANTVCFASQLYWPHQGLPYSVFGPTVTPGYHQQIRPFAEMLREEQMRACLVVFCDTKHLTQSPTDAKHHWQWCYTAVGDQPNWTLVCANQLGHHTQADWLTLDFIRQLGPPPSVAGFPPLLAAPYNPHEDELPLTCPGWAFSCFCSKRHIPLWWAEGSSLSMATVIHLGANGRPPTNQATVLFEPPPAGRKGDYLDARAWRDFARMCATKGANGGNYYSNEDAEARVYPDGPSRNCAVECCGNWPPA